MPFDRLSRQDGERLLRYRRLGRGVRALLAEIVDHDLGPRRRERLRDAEPDALPASRHQCLEAVQLDDAFGLLLRAIEANPHVLVVHLEMWRTLRALGVGGEAVESLSACAPALTCAVR